MKRAVLLVRVLVPVALFAGCGGDNGNDGDGAAGDGAAGSAGISSAEGGASGSGAGSDGGGVGPGNGGASTSDDGNCAFTPCGGDVVGSWSLDEVCYSEELLVATLNGDAPEECSGFYTGLTIQASGTLEFTAGGTLTRQSSMTMDHEFALDAECMQASYGSAPSAESCAQVAVYLGAGAESASCNHAAGACQCAVRSESSEDVTDAYTTSGSTLSDSEGPIEYCVLGNVLQLRDTSDAGSMVLTFRRQ